jgi:hypothetical protein
MMAAAVAGATLLGGCEVTNPGPVNDDFLTLPAAQQGFVDGGKERLVRLVGWAAYSTGLIAREIFPGGQTGSYGHSVQNQAGSHTWNSSGPNTEYNNSQQARWVAEEALRRFEELGDVSAQLRSEAHVWAGYANRVLGENYCEAVIDGGPLQPGRTYFERAEDHFTAAISIAEGEWKTAAYAGRAQVRIWLEDWAGAVADASQVPSDFAFMLEMDITQGSNTNQRNHLYFAAASIPYRSYSVKHTFFEGYYTQTGDPRTPWTTYALESDNRCVGSLQGYAGGRVPCLRQWKYKSEDDDIRLASGREMRLLEAEALLETGNLAGALAKINAVRQSINSETTGQPLEQRQANTLEEGWTMLKRERMIELWLEGRRMGDQRRWGGEFVSSPQSTPGSIDLPNWETISSLFRNNPRGREATESSGATGPRILCYNISDAERNTNDNIPDVSG